MGVFWVGVANARVDPTIRYDGRLEQSDRPSDGLPKARLAGQRAIGKVSFAGGQRRSGRRIGHVVVTPSGFCQTRWLRGGGRQGDQRLSVADQWARAVQYDGSGVQILSRWALIPWPLEWYWAMDALNRPE